MAVEGASGVAVEAQGPMADEAASSHEVATAVATVGASVVRHAALRRTRRWLSNLFNENFKTMAYSRLHEGFLGV